MNLQLVSRLNAFPLGQSPTATHAEFAWTNMPQGVGIFALILVVAAILYGVFYFYHREIDTCSRGVKLLLATLRAAVLIILTVVFLGPALISVRTRTVHPTIALLRDASLSMNTADRSGETTGVTAAESTTSANQVGESARPTRAELLNNALDQHDGEFLQALSRKGRVRVVDFAQQSSLVESRGAANTDASESLGSAASDRDDFKPLPPLKPNGTGTDIAAAVADAVETENPSAIILFTDGQHTGKDDPRLAARAAREQGIAILVVGLGDATRPRDLRVTNVYVRPQIWSGEPFEIEAELLAQGIEGGEAKIELLEKSVSENDASTSAQAVVGQQSVAIPAGGGRINCQFSHTVKDIGKYIYAVRVEPVADELSEQDNQLDSQVTKVLSREKVRVLLVAGAPTWEFRMVEKLLQREKSMEVSCWLQTLDEGRAQEGSRPITHLPVTREELFWYDVVLLFDPNPKEFDQQWMDLVKQFVGDHAGGLLYMAGPKFSDTLLTSARTSTFRDLLPVRFGDIGAMAVSSMLSTNSQSWPLKVAPTGMEHPVMTFYSDRQQTLQRWETLPGIFWSFPSLEAKPTAQVLVEHSDPTLRSVEGTRPLLVSGRYGAGQVLYLGFNGTWRWRKAGSQAEFFDKFWIQAVRYLVEARSLEGRRRGNVQTDRDRYELGEKVTITARLQDTSYQPLVADKIEATLHVNGENPVALPLLPVANQPGSFEGTYLPRKVGQNVLRVRIPGASTSDSVVEAPFQVELPSVETSQVWLNKPLLTDLANLGGDGGGYYELNQLSALAAAVPDKTNIVEIRSPPKPLWDIPEVLVALVVLLGIEWFVRKRNKLL